MDDREARGNDGKIERIEKGSRGGGPKRNKKTISHGQLTQGSHNYIS